MAEYRQPGSNGLALDPQGRLTINQHGNRRVVRLEKDGRETLLAERFEGKRLNSPNDLVYRSDGTLFFTDPPFGLPKFGDDPRKELPFSGVYSLRDGRLRLVSRDFTGPNGLALSPDEKYRYVGDWDTKRVVVMRYEVRPDGTLANGRPFFDMTPALAEDAVQETLLAALRARHTYGGRSAERTWLTGILKHKLVDHFRRASRQAYALEDEGEGFEHEELFRREGKWKDHFDPARAPVEWDATPAALLERGEFWEVFDTCLSPLPARISSAFILRELEGLSGGEVCEVLGISANNLWVMLHRARTHLRRCLELNWFKPKGDRR